MCILLLFELALKRLLNTTLLLHLFFKPGSSPFELSMLLFEFRLFLFTALQFFVTFPQQYSERPSRPRLFLEAAEF